MLWGRADRKFKQNGYAAMEAKIEKQNAVDKIKNEKYREENQNRYQYKEKTKCTMIYLMITNPGTM